MNLEIKNITKSYSKDKDALINFNMTLSSGILGLLGPNGAGKSTLMKVISTIIQPTSGEILLNGINIITQPDEIRQVLGYLPQDFGVYDNLNAVEFLTYIAALKGIESKGLTNRIEYYLDAFNLMDVSKKQIGTYSGGMKQRVGIIQALLNDPKIILFDEPTVGLDPQERVRFRQLISELSGDRIIILSSHIVSDIESIADQIAIMKNGRLLQFGSYADLTLPLDKQIATAIVDRNSISPIKQKFTILDSMRHGDQSKIRFMIKDKQPDFQFELSDASLEDAYLIQTLDSHHVA